MSTNAFDVVITHVGAALEELANLLSDDVSRGDLLANLGYAIPGAGSLAPLFDDVATAASSVANTLPVLKEAYENESADAELIELLFNLTDDIINAMSAIDELANKGPAVLTGQDVPELLGQRLLDFLLLRYLQEQVPVAASVLEVVGLADIRFVQDTETQPSFFLYEIHWDRFELLWSDPKALFEQAYDWGTEAFNSDNLLTRIQALFWHLGVTSQLVVDDEKLQLETPVWSGMFEPGEGGAIAMFEAGLLLERHSDNTDTTNAGLMLSPYIEGELAAELEVAPGWRVELATNGELDGGLGALLQPQSGLRVVTNDSGAPVNAAVSVEITLARVPIDETGMIILIGERGATRWEAEKLFASFGFSSATSTESELWTSLGLQNSALVINSEDGDGFLSKILPPDGIKAEFEIVVGWSSIDGIYFQGSAGLEITIPIHLSAGPLELESIYLMLSLSDQGFDMALGVSISAELGPLSASIQRIGLRGDLQSAQSGNGNFGPIDLSLGFLPPIGAGLSISAGVTGGGFIEFDEANERYAGILALQFGEIGLTAIGLITTRLPDGSKGFSMLVNIGVTFDPAIQISMGFTLNGVGGLVGINRSMDIEVLQRGIKQRTLDSILFPDPDTVIANANKIISDLRAVFPPTRDQFVVGPMVKIAYGTPALITADIGIFIEFPDPIRIVLMGQVAMALPEEKQPIVSIHLDILGVLDFEKEVLTFQASLYDSTILVYVLAGDAAFLLSWGNSPQFAMSLGGFHPKFPTPPPPIIFGDLTRLSLSLSSGSSFQLTCAAYQALTPNSLQFGARVDLYAKEGGAEVTGFLGFDALIYFSPFSFEVWIGGGVVIKVEGHTLADIDISLMLSGPTPWDARGKARIKVLFFDIDVGFHVTWGSRNQKTLPAIDPWLPLQDALADSGNWSGVLPRGSTVVESLREMDDEQQPFVVHPAGSLEIRQKVAPLNIKLSKVGNAPVKGHNKFIINYLSVDGEIIDVDPVDEFFARGQVEKLSAQQQLSVPAFEKYQGGVVSQASAAIKVEGIENIAPAAEVKAVEEKPLMYESILINPEKISEKQDEPAPLQWRDAKQIARVKHIRQARNRSGTRKTFGSLRVKEQVRVQEELYCIAYASTLTRADLGVDLNPNNYDLTRIAAEQLLSEHLNKSPDDKDQLMVVPEYELEQAA